MRKMIPFVAVMAALAWAALAAVPAAAGGNSSTPCSIGPQPSTCTYTQNAHAVTQTFPANVPCIDPVNGPPTGMLTFTFNGVFHETVNRAGDGWFTSTQTGTISFAPFDPARPSYSGRTETWFGESFNQNNLVLHDTFNGHAAGSDGSTLSFHIVDHYSISASGITHTFDKVVC